MPITVLTEADLRQCVAVDDDALKAVADGFSALARGDVVMPPILRLDVEDHLGELDVKTAYVRGFDGFAVKMSSGYFDNPKLGLSPSGGMMTLFDARTGHVRAVLLDNGYLTEVRTAAAGAVAARHLAPATIETVGVIGAGIQARMQVEALTLVRAFARVRVWARDPGKARDYADEMAPRLGVKVAPADDREDLVRTSDMVITATPSHAPLVAGDWLHPGLHVTAIGSDSEEKNELEPSVLAAADLYVCDSRAQCLRLGELHHAVEAGVVAADAPVIELGRIIAGDAEGRTNDREITVCDLTGTGVQDTAIATVAYAKAINKGLGLSVGD